MEICTSSTKFLLEICCFKEKTSVLAWERKSSLHNSIDYIVFKLAEMWHFFIIAAVHFKAGIYEWKVPATVKVWISALLEFGEFKSSCFMMSVYISLKNIYTSQCFILAWLPWYLLLVLWSHICLWTQTCWQLGCWLVQTHKTSGKDTQATNTHTHTLNCAVQSCSMAGSTSGEWHMWQECG